MNILIFSKNILQLKNKEKKVIINQSQKKFIFR